MIAHSTSVELFYNVAQQLNASSELDGTLSEVLQLTLKATEATQGTLLILDHQGNITRKILVHPPQSPTVFNHTVRKITTENFADWVYRHRQSLLIPNTKTDQRWGNWINASRKIPLSVLAVPLISQEQITGILILQHEQENFFDEMHLSLAVGVAGQTAVTLSNAHLFNQLKTKHEELYALIRCLPIPVLVVANDRLVFRNRSAEQLLHITDMNLPLGAIEGGDRLKEALSTLQEGDEQHSMELVWTNDRVFHLSANEIARHGLVVVLNDITYLKELGEAKTQFVETVSHDLKNPLSAIKGFATLLQFEQNLSERGRNNLTKLLSCVDHMQELIDDLLDLAQIEADVGGEVGPCNITQVIKEVLEYFQVQLEQKQMTLTVNLPSQISRIAANSTRLFQVVSNLVSNAIKYTPKGGQITVNVSQEAHEILLEVIDSGSGISPTSQVKLFQKFYRADEHVNQIEGTGLGLSIVRAIVEGYGGKVWVESELGVGSTFRCLLPAISGS